MHQQPASSMAPLIGIAPLGQEPFFGPNGSTLTQLLQITLLPDRACTAHRRDGPPIRQRATHERGADARHGRKCLTIYTPTPTPPSCALWENPFPTLSNTHPQQLQGLCASRWPLLGGKVLSPRSQGSRRWAAVHRMPRCEAVASIFCSRPSGDLRSMKCPLSTECPQSKKLQLRRSALTINAADSFRWSTLPPGPSTIEV